MSPAALFRRIEEHAALRPDDVAIEDGGGAPVTWGALPAAIARMRESLRGLGAHAVGVMAENGIPQALLDLAALAEGILLVPLPPFFSDVQVRWTARSAELELILTDDPGRVAEAFWGRAPVAGSFHGLTAFRVGPRVPRSTTCARITFTSGSTGEPRGVKLEARTLLTVARSLADATEMSPRDRHVGLLPHAVLLENIGGLYRCMVAGATCVVPPLHTIGMRGSVGTDGPALAAALARLEATTGILVPGMLESLVAALEAAPTGRLPRARFFGVGGARVPVTLLERAREVGLPAFEGYGLSEATSVVTLNRPGAERCGTAGRPLPHVDVRIDEDGEVLVRGALFSGYVGGGDLPSADGWWRTGDLGHLDADGFLHIRGRRRNVFITSFGRNVSPEWVEAALTDGTSITRAVVFGEGRPAPVALLVHRSSRARAEADLRRVLPTLPDYARPDHWVLTDEPLTVASGLLTPNGRPRRDAVWEAWRDVLEVDPANVAIA
jgi:long-subunit acyl-CoA synthetase (AMP-forming)